MQDWIICLKKKKKYIKGQEWAVLDSCLWCIALTVVPFLTAHACMQPCIYFQGLLFR